MTALVLLIVLNVIGFAVQGRRTRMMPDALKDAPDGPLPATLRAQIDDPVLSTTIAVFAGILVSIPLPMTVKPGLRDAILIVAIGGVAGGLASLPAWKRAGSPARPERAGAAAEAD